VQLVQWSIVYQWEGEGQQQWVSFSLVGDLFGDLFGNVWHSPDLPGVQLGVIYERVRVSNTGFHM